MKTSRNSLILSLLILLTAIFITPGLYSGERTSQNEIISRIRLKYRPMYDTYSGIESVRHVTVKEYDSRNEKLLHTMKLVLKRKDYFYKKPVVTVLSYIRDGKKMRPADYKGKNQPPGLPIFDKRGEDNYKLTLVGTEKIEGASCYKIKVTPRKITERHFTGTLYLDTDTLDQVFAKGTMARLGFPLKKFSLEFKMDMLKGVPVITGGRVEILLHVPVFYPHRRFVSEIKATDIKLLPVE